MQKPAALARTRLAVPLALGLCLLVTASGQTTTETQVAAYYHHGYSRNYAWRATVNTDGSIAQEVKREPGMFAPDSWTRRTTPPVSRGQVRALFEALASTDLCSFEGTYSPAFRPGDVSRDVSTLVLEVSMEGRRCRVSVYGGDLTLRVDGHPRKVEVRRFCAAWGKFLAVVPPPNRWQTPDTCV